MNYFVPTNLSQLEYQLTRLPGAKAEAILEFFSHDLRSLDAKRIIGILEMTFLFMDPVAAREVKKQIVNALAPENRGITALVQYLQREAGRELEDVIPIRETSSSVSSSQGVERGKAATVSLHPQDYIQTSFPENDHFDFGDMQDVDKFRAVGAPPFSPHQWKEKIEALERLFPEDVKKSFEDDILLKKRFESAIVTYLKDIRDRLETYERLIAPVSEGGIGLPHSMVEKLFAVLDNRPQSKSASDLNTAPALPPPAPAPTSAPAPSPVPPSAPAPPPKPLPLPLPRVSPPKLTAETVSLKQAHSLEPISLNIKKVEQLKQAAPIRQFTDITPKQQPEGGTSRRQAVPTVDPIGVYSTMSIEDIRREGDREEFAAKFIAKIQTESEGDYTHKAKILAAWKQSPLYKEYIAIGRESLKQGLGVSKYLAGQTREGAMTYQEFEMITELNQKLRF